MVDILIPVFTILLSASIVIRNFFWYICTTCLHSLKHLTNEQFYSHHQNIFIYKMYIDVIKKIQTITYIKVRSMNTPGCGNGTKWERKDVLYGYFAVRIYCDSQLFLVHLYDLSPFFKTFDNLYVWSSKITDFLSLFVSDWIMSILSPRTCEHYKL
jgi:hypothetical protein